MKTKKKILAIMLSVIMVLSLFSPIGTGASDMSEMTTEAAMSMETSTEPMAANVSETINADENVAETEAGFEVMPEETLTENLASTEFSAENVAKETTSEEEAITEGATSGEEAITEGATSEEEAITEGVTEDNSEEQDTVESESQIEDSITEVAETNSENDETESESEDTSVATEDENEKDEITTESIYYATDITNQITQLKLNLGNAWYLNQNDEVIALEELVGAIDYSSVSDINTVGFDVLYRINLDGEERNIHTGDWFEVTLPSVFTNVRLNSIENYGSELPVDAVDVQIDGNIVKVFFKDIVEEENVIGIHGTLHLAFEVVADELSTEVSEYFAGIQEGNGYTFYLPAEASETEQTINVDLDKIENVKNQFTTIINDYFAEQLPEEVWNNDLYEIILNTVLTMDQDILDQCMDQTLTAMELFDELSYEEAEYFIENEPGLYNVVMISIAEVLAAVMNGDAMPMSLLPLTEKKAYLVVGNHGDISAVPVDLILKNLLDSEGNPININSDAKVVWSYYKDLENNIIFDDYFVIEEGGTLDLSLFEERDKYLLEMIVGDGNQLNMNNERYIVTVYLSDTVNEFRTYELFAQDINGERHKIEPADVTTNSVVVLGKTSSSRTFIVPNHVPETEYYLGVNSQLDEHPYVQLDVLTYPEYLAYTLYQAMGMEYEYTTINDQILKQNMYEKDAGYKNNWDEPEVTEDSVEIKNTLAFLYKDSITGEIYAEDLMTFSVASETTYFEGEIYTYVDEKFENVVLASTYYTDVENVDLNDDWTLIGSDATHINLIYLKEGYSSNEEYYYNLQCYNPAWENTYEHVVKAVEGPFASLESASGATDIKEQLFVTGGYKANYNIEQGGVYFTIFFDDGSIYKIIVAVKDYDERADVNHIQEYSDVPIVGEADPWFRITGAKDSQGSTLDTYVIENGKNINIDTMYGYGYQSVIINNADVTSIEPTFWSVNSELVKVESIYVNGQKFAPGEVISFPNGSNVINATFSVIINDGELHTKNYNVAFIKKTGGGQLYVAGPVAPEVRSVFLDEYFEYKHDIFIANIGDEVLTDLRLELDATNVMLDSYWTIGGEGNDTLSACPENFEMKLMETSYGELPNVAKIRLVPDGNNGGNITGTLKIYSADELLETINLSGLAQNPKITTNQESFASYKAVKYVPYAYLISTNNMYDWTEVSFKLTGELPEGMEFYPSTGEIYGVPQTAGEFKFQIEATFKSETYQFESSVVELTLTVSENTNDNVFLASDEEYEIEQAIGTQTGAYDFVLESIEDTIFTSCGELGEFVDVWLNGQPLVPEEDYEAIDGSTKITIWSKTIEEKANRDGVNTIAAEFREGGDSKNDLKRTAQNFVLNIKEEETDTETPGTEKPSEPETEKPNEPGTEKPSEPGTEKPSEPGTEKPSEPGTEKPSEPGTEKPSEPGTEKPSEPETEEPSEPESEDSNEPETEQSNNAEDEQNQQSEEAEKVLSCMVYMVDAAGNPIANLPLEFHSTPQAATTGADGKAKFVNIEYGSHTLYVVNDNGNSIASKSFSIQEGERVAINGDTITANEGETVILKVQYSDGNLSLISATDGSAPETGDNTNICMWLLLLLLSFETMTITYERKKRVR